MKKLLFIVFALIVTCVAAFAQGDPELTKNENNVVDGFAPRSITAYSHTKAAVSIPLATNVSKYCLSSTAAGTVQINGTGSTKAIAASTDYCRSVRRGVTSIVFTGASSATKTITVEKQY